MRTPTTVGVIGMNSFGTALAHMFNSLPQATLRWLCDYGTETPPTMLGPTDDVRVTSRPDDLLEDESLDAVVLAMPPAIRSELAHRTLEAEKDLFVSEPLALEKHDAESLVSLAEHGERVLVVGHMALFDPALRKLKELIDAGRLGDLYYLHATDRSLGVFEPATDVLLKLASRNVSAVLHLAGDEPIAVTAQSESYVQTEVPDVVFCFLKFATGVTAHLHLSRLDPCDVMNTTVVGSKRMAVLDPLDRERTLSVFEKSVIARPGAGAGAALHVRLGNITSPRIWPANPLRLACEHFLEAIQAPFALGRARPAAAVVDVLEELQRAFGRDPVTVASLPPEPHVIPLPLDSR